MAPEVDCLLVLSVPSVTYPPAAFDHFFFLSRLPVILRVRLALSPAYSDFFSMSCQSGSRKHKHDLSFDCLQSQINHHPFLLSLYGTTLGQGFAKKHCDTLFHKSLEEIDIFFLRQNI